MYVESQLESGSGTESKTDILLEQKPVRNKFSLLLLINTNFISQRKIP
jgi:hypothetical protein